MLHRRFLVHRYRSKKMMKYFVGSIETEHAPERRNVHYMYHMVKTIKVAYGKKKKDGKTNKKDML